MTQVDDHVIMRLISQLISGPKFGTANGCPKIGTANSTATPIFFEVTPVVFILDLNDSESAKVAFGSSLQHY